MNYHSINHKMWTGRNGTIRKILRDYDDNTYVVASYLMTAPQANQSGVFSCPVIFIANETERSPESVEKALSNLSVAGFCKYDDEEQVVWVINMVRYQVDSWPNKSRDNKYKGVFNALATVQASHLVDEFLEFWQMDATGASNLLNPSPVHDRTVGTLTSGLQGASADTESEASEVIQ